MERIYLRRAIKIITVGHSMKDYLLKEHNVSELKIEVVGAGVNHELFQFSGNSSNEFRVFVARRLEPRMGILELISAWGMTKIQNRGKLNIAGTGSQIREVQDLISKLGLEDSIKLLGRISESELVRQYRDSTVSIVPTSALEGFGLVCLESFSCGTPVISTKVGELRYLIGERWPELTYDSGQPHQLAEILDHVSSNRNLLPLRSDVREFAYKFSWELTTLKINRLYAKILY